MVIFLICLCALSVLIAVFAFIEVQTTKKLVKEFKHCNVIVFGKKGSGKDLVFQKVINKRKAKYFSNVNYGNDYNYISMYDLKLGVNDYHNFIKEDVKICEKDFRLEDNDIYLSDVGVYLPSQMDSMLHKTYPSFPILYALSRHLYNNNIHCNTQNLARPWKALREQADFYVKVRYTLNLGFFLLTRVTLYEKYSSAESELQPLKTRVLNNYSKAEYDQYVATNGYIKNGFICQLKKSLKYDTREFHKKLFGYRFIKSKQSKKECA